MTIPASGGTPGGCGGGGVTASGGAGVQPSAIPASGKPGSQGGY